MKISLNNKAVAAIVGVSLILGTVFVKGSADGTTPGSDVDPVVTLSYVELKSEQTKYYIDNLIAKSNQDITALKTQLDQKNQEIAKLQETVAQLTAGGGNAGFVVVPLKKGQTLLTGSGSEIMLRLGGKATAILGEAGGLVNATSGAGDLKSGENVPVNHLLISSRDDGRGIKASVDSYLLVRGGYTIK